MKISDLDEKIALFYAEQILLPIKYGENSVFFWFPGAGMTTIINDIVKNKNVLKKNLGKLTSNLKFFQLWGHLPNQKNLLGLLNEAGFKNQAAIKESCSKLLEEGNEIVYVIGRIDDYEDNEKIDILKLFVRLQALNPRRVHIMLNLIDKPWFVKTLSEHNEFVCLANRMEVVPVLKGDLLTTYIKDKAAKFEFRLSETDITHITKTYGGILQFTKEYLRSKGNLQTLELKLKLIWDKLPASYKDVLKQLAGGNNPQFINQDILDLRKFGLWDLKLFETHRDILSVNSEEILSKILTQEESNLWSYCKNHTGEFIDKNIVINLIRPDDNNNTSLWAIDKALSRFRKKLAKSGVDPEMFKTLKGRGYIWTNPH